MPHTYQRFAWGNPEIIEWEEDIAARQKSSPCGPSCIPLCPPLCHPACNPAYSSNCGPAAGYVCPPFYRMYRKN